MFVLGINWVKGDQFCWYSTEKLLDFIGWLAVWSFQAQKHRWMNRFVGGFEHHYCRPTKMMMVYINHFWVKHLPSLELTYSLPKVLLKMILLFLRWDMLVPWRVSKPKSHITWEETSIHLQGDFCSPRIHDSNLLESFLGISPVLNQQKKGSPWRKKLLKI